MKIKIPIDIILFISAIILIYNGKTECAMNCFLLAMIIKYIKIHIE